MSSQIIGVFAVAILAAATVYAAGHAARRLGRPLPKWVLPFTIAAAIILFTIWNDYDWSRRLRAQLPPTFEVLGTGTGLKAMRPWTFVVPVTTRFSGMDRAAVIRAGNIARGTIFFVERGQRTRTMMMEFDCAATRERPLAADGTARDWMPVPGDDPSFLIACDGGG